MKSKIIIKKDGKWFIASYPRFGLVTQGKTEKEARNNINELIEDYLENSEDLEVKKSYLKKLEKIRKQKHHKFKNIKELREIIGSK